MADVTTLEFLEQAQLSVVPGSAAGRDMGLKVKSLESLKKDSLLHSCPFCYTLLLPTVSTVSTISKKRLRKKVKRELPILHSSKLHKKHNHFLKIHCKVCNKTHLIPCQRKPQSTQKTPSSSVKSTPRRKRRSIDLKSLFKQTTPKITPTPSLLDFLF